MITRLIRETDTQFRDHVIMRTRALPSGGTRLYLSVSCNGVTNKSSHDYPSALAAMDAAWHWADQLAMHAGFIRRADFISGITPAYIDREVHTVQNVTTHRGGKVHNPATYTDAPFPECRTGAQSSGTGYRFTDAPVDCRNCTAQNEARALAEQPAPAPLAEQPAAGPAPLAAGADVTITAPGYPGVWTVVASEAERTAADPANRGTVQVRRVLDNDGDPAVWVTVVRDIDVQPAASPAVVEAIEAPTPAPRPTAGPARGEAVTFDDGAVWLVTRAEADLIAEGGERVRGWYRAERVFAGAGGRGVTTVPVRDGRPAVSPASIDGARGVQLTTAAGPIVVPFDAAATVEPLRILDMVRTTQAEAGLAGDAVEVECRAGTWSPVVSRLAYSPANVVYLVEGEHIAALWTPAPELAALGGAALFDRLADRSVEIELIGQARRQFKSRGSLYSGWVIEMGANHLEPIGRKRDAHAMLVELVGDYFGNAAAARAGRAEQPAATPVEVAEQPAATPVEVAEQPAAVGHVVTHHGHGADYILTSPLYGRGWWARPLGAGADVTIDDAALAAGLVTVTSTGAAPAPAVHDAITIDGAEGVWVVTHTPDAPAKLGPASYAPDTRTPVGRVMGAFGYYQARRVFDGSGEDLPMAFGAAGARWAHGPADAAPVGTMGVWFTAGNGPVVVPVVEQYLESAPRCAERVRTWQRRVERNVDAVLVVRVGDGWVDGAGRTLAPAGASTSPAAPVEVEAVEAPLAPVLPQADDAAPLARRSGHVEIFPGNTLPDRLASADRGRWVHASNCTRRLILEWALYFADSYGEHVRVIIEGRAAAEHAVDITREVQAGILGGRPNAALMCRVPGGAWDLAPHRTAAEREADAAATRSR